ncbi:MAG: hypothetical protein ACPH56_09050 [Spongiibacter marinus]|jgi:hypothetical protein|uniref:hypothetical protein n=1 Tax=Spongiibacter TaxID=630749 RepID=UPI000C0ABE26|nr:hypothetical protein [Spongiibacter sp.]MAK43994.1 hypothetical protein [Spongiibacter sp.]|tara:strand:- start:599 stop:913 length:315 start_codon:yes stop_codon:yes gene_type:complete
MKVHLELEIEPEELRRLVGLPDMQPIWDSVQKRITEGDTEMVQQIAKTAFTEGMKTLDMTTRLLKTVSGLATKRDSESKTQTKTKPSARKTPAKRRASSAKTSE